MSIVSVNNSNGLLKNVVAVVYTNFSMSEALVQNFILAVKSDEGVEYTNFSSGINQQIPVKI